MDLVDPIILTLQLDEKSFLYFEEKRQQYFPKERNFLRAHLTLFHHLPPLHLHTIIAEVELMGQQLSAVTLQVTEVKMIGRGVAYKIESERLVQLHRKLQQVWQEWLTPQDKQKLWPHVTVQNKVRPEEAKALYERLIKGFEPFEGKGVGLQLWAYKGGPWELLQTISFN